MSTDESSGSNENPCCNSMVWTIKGKRGARKASTIHGKPKSTVPVPDPHHHSSSFSYADDVTAESLLLLAKVGETDHHGDDQNIEAGLNRNENRLKEEKSKRIYCRACDIFLSSAQALGGHKRGKMHRYYEANMKQHSESDDVTDNEHKEDNNKQQKTRLISEMNFDQNLPKPLSDKQKVAKATVVNQESSVKVSDLEWVKNELQLTKMLERLKEEEDIQKGKMSMLQSPITATSRIGQQRLDATAHSRREPWCPLDRIALRLPSNQAATTRSATHLHIPPHWTQPYSQPQLTNPIQPFNHHVDTELCLATPLQMTGPAAHNMRTKPLNHHVDTELSLATRLQMTGPAAHNMCTGRFQSHPWY